MNALRRALMAIGSIWCHQIPDRSPHLFGAQMPLCWRCSGITGGALLLLVYLFFCRRLPALTPSAALALVLPLDVLAFWLGFDDYATGRRLLTGLLWGYGATGVTLRLAAFLFNRRTREGASTHPASLFPRSGNLT